MYIEGLENVDEVDQFLKSHKLLKVTQDETDLLNSPIIITEIECVV